MARVSKLKKRQLYWLSQIEKQAGGEENIVTGENLEKLMPLPEPPTLAALIGGAPLSGA